MMRDTRPNEPDRDPRRFDTPGLPAAVWRADGSVKWPNGWSLEDKLSYLDSLRREHTPGRPAGPLDSDSFIQAIVADLHTEFGAGIYDRIKELEKAYTAKYHAIQNSGADQSPPWIGAGSKEGPARLEELIVKLITQGEGVDLEIKPLLRWNSRKGAADKNFENGVFKTVAAFLNTNGGTLLIGMDFGGAVLKRGYNYRVPSAGRGNFEGEDKDRFERYLQDILSNNFDTDVVAKNVRVWFLEFEGVEICRVEVQKSRYPVIISLKHRQGQFQEKFYIRKGSLSKELSGNERFDYMRKNF